MNKGFVTVFILLSMVSTGYAQVNQQNLNECSDIKDSQERLACYDASSINSSTSPSSNHMNNNIDKFETLSERIKSKLATKEQTQPNRKLNFGDWRVSNYVDNFGEATNNRYITNNFRIVGVFSNIATQNSSLVVRFLIGGRNDFAFMLYQYARNNPEKHISEVNYYVQVQDNAGTRYIMTAIGSGERIKFNFDNSRILHDAFLKGGTVKFRVSNMASTNTKYSFQISALQGYKEAYTELTGRVVKNEEEMISDYYGYLKYSDNYSKFKAVFSKATYDLLISGVCREENFSNAGGWRKDPQSANDVYFIRCENENGRTSWYLDATKGITSMSNKPISR